MIRRLLAWIFLTSAAIVGFLLGFGVSLTGISVWTLLGAPHVIESTTANAFLFVGLGGIGFGLMWGYGLTAWARARAAEGRKPIMTLGLVFAGAGAAASIGFLVLLATRAS